MLTKKQQKNQVEYRLYQTITSVKNFIELSIIVVILMKCTKMYVPNYFC